MLSAKEIIQGLKPCTYRYNDIKPLGDKLNWGFLAQDILEVFGEDYNFVQKNEGDEYFQVNYFQFIAPLVSLVKEQQEEINKLKEEMDKLRARL